MNNQTYNIDCFGLIVFIFLTTAILFGLPTPWGKYNIDIIPPRVWEMSK